MGSGIQEFKRLIQRSEKLVYTQPKSQERERMLNHLPGHPTGQAL